MTDLIQHRDVWMREVHTSLRPVHMYMGQLSRNHFKLFPEGWHLKQMGCRAHCACAVSQFHQTVFWPSRGKIF